MLLIETVQASNVLSVPCRDQQTNMVLPCYPASYSFALLGAKTRAAQEVNCVAIVHTMEQLSRDLWGFVML